MIDEYTFFLARDSRRRVPTSTSTSVPVQGLVHLYSCTAVLLLSTTCRSSTSVQLYLSTGTAVPVQLYYRTSTSRKEIFPRDELYELLMDFWDRSGIIIKTF